MSQRALMMMVCGIVLVAWALFTSLLVQVQWLDSPMQAIGISTLWVILALTTSGTRNGKDRDLGHAEGRTHELDLYFLAAPRDIRHLRIAQFQVRDSIIAPQAARVEVLELDSIGPGILCRFGKLPCGAHAAIVVHARLADYKGHSAQCFRMLTMRALALPSPKGIVRPFCLRPIMRVLMPSSGAS